MFLIHVLASMTVTWHNGNRGEAEFKQAWAKGFQTPGLSEERAPVIPKPFWGHSQAPALHRLGGNLQVSELDLKE